MGENGKDKLVREFKNYEMKQVNVRSKESARDLLLRQVWGAGDPRDFDTGAMTEHRFLPRPCVSLTKNVKIFSR